ncbi:single-stranded DNA-binding protein [Methylibium sp.]|uniref:single-stranded DNA-binding protein n=1 Tax=Methylibium sp. TaxID=2067992 RepID=UPI00184BF964|nr:single-stranded DNA-binding protein [Methylibium sp.]MBA3591750.1 single-stranded DNA-binding protein [Methylibium sp.]
MSANVNRVFLIGNCTRDPQVKMISGDRAVANFGLAINERWKDKDGQQKESTVFVDCEAWGRTAELVGQYVIKGKPLFVEGKLKLDTWDDKDGGKRSKLKVVVDSVQFLGSKSSGDAGGEDHHEPAAPAAAPASAQARAPQVPKPVAGKGAAVEDEIPFARFDP